MSVSDCSKLIIDSIVRIQYTPDVNFFNIYPREKIYDIAGIQYPAGYGYESENKFGELLMRMNAQSYYERYKHNENSEKVLEDNLALAAEYKFTPPHDGKTQLEMAIRAYASIRYWKYQCSEANNYKGHSIWQAVKVMEKELTYRIIHEFAPQIDDMWGK